MDLSACRPLGRAASHSSQSQYKFRRITPRPLLNSSGQAITLHRSKSHISISPVISQPARKLSQLYRPSPYVPTKLIALPFKVDSLSLIKESANITTTNSFHLLQCHSAPTIIRVSSHPTIFSCGIAPSVIPAPTGLFNNVRSAKKRLAAYTPKRMCSHE